MPNHKKINAKKRLSVNIISYSAYDQYLSILLSISSKLSMLQSKIQIQDSRLRNCYIKASKNQTIIEYDQLRTYTLLIKEK